MALDAVTSGESGTPGDAVAPSRDGTGAVEPVELETPTRRGDVVAASLCLATGLAGCLLVVPAAVHVPTRYAGTVNSPAFLPNALFVLLAVLGAIYLAVSLAACARGPAQGRARASDWGLAAGTALICIGYVGAIFVLGMTLASALCVTCAMVFFGERRPVVIGAIAILLPAALWYFFIEIAHVLFPTPLVDVAGWLRSALRPGS